MPFGDHRYIMLVEDDVDLRSTLVLTLQISGYPVIGMANGLEALKMLVDKNKHKPSLLITNINMPVIDGRLLLAVMNLCPQLDKIPIVVASGEDMVIDPRYGILKKPYSVQDILKLVEFHGISRIDGNHTLDPKK
ncbi:MAG: response regulator [Acidobacteriaceae bacterium]|nr:response regulator [Acidobacteriaceae bacterium]